MPLTDLIARVNVLGSPGGLLAPVASAILIDSVLVYPETYAADDRGGPEQTDGTPASLPCQIFSSTSGVVSAPMAHREDRDDRPVGIVHYILLFGSDPGVSRPDQRIDWTAHSGTDLSPARTLRTIAASRPPGGGDLLWRVDAEEIS